MDRIVVVGGGVLGMMHALQARSRGLSVVRWAGVYSQVTGSGLYHRSSVAPGVVLVTGPGGRGMTCAPVIAEETFA
ncbi:MAG: hypothetical protein ACLQFR_25845 [Streptosporangiaceae bacterium]